MGGVYNCGACLPFDLDGGVGLSDSKTIQMARGIGWSAFL
jgi:hypothetical protein